MTECTCMYVSVNVVHVHVQHCKKRSHIQNEPFIHFITIYTQEKWWQYKCGLYAITLWQVWILKLRSLLSLLFMFACGEVHVDVYYY